MLGAGLRWTELCNLTDVLLQRLAHLKELLPLLHLVVDAGDAAQYIKQVSLVRRLTRCNRLRHGKQGISRHGQPSYNSYRSTNFGWELFCHFR